MSLKSDLSQSICHKSCTQMVLHLYGPFHVLSKPLYLKILLDKCCTWKAFHQYGSFHAFPSHCVNWNIKRSQHAGAYSFGFLFIIMSCRPLSSILYYFSLCSVCLSSKSRRIVLNRQNQWSSKIYASVVTECVHFMLQTFSTETSKDQKVLFISLFTFD